MTPFDPNALTDGQLSACLEVLRRRGYAVAAYGAAELGEGPMADQDGSYDEAKCAKFLADNREYLEDAMCKGVWDYCENDDAI